MFDWQNCALSSVRTIIRGPTKVNIQTPQAGFDDYYFYYFYFMLKGKRSFLSQIYKNRVFAPMTIQMLKSFPKHPSPIFWKHHDFSLEKI